jgi:hypothetical protein
MTGQRNLPDGVENLSSPPNQGGRLRSARRLSADPCRADTFNFTGESRSNQSRLWHCRDTVAVSSQLLIVPIPCFYELGLWLSAQRSGQSRLQRAGRRFESVSAHNKFLGERGRSTKPGRNRRGDTRGNGDKEAEHPTGDGGARSADRRPARRDGGEPAITTHQRYLESAR